MICFHNRDEMFERPTGDFRRETKSGLLCARDLEKNGTWLGFNYRTGAFAMLTNARHRLTRPRSNKSRGEIVERALKGTLDPILHSSRYSTITKPCVTVAYNLVRCANVWNLCKNGFKGEDVIFECCVPVAKTEKTKYRTSAHKHCKTDDQSLEWKRVLTSIPTGVYARSNESTKDIRDGEWPKTSFVRQEVETILANSPKSLNGEDGARQILAGFAEIMGITKREYKDISENLAATTTLTLEQERVCQQGPFIRAEELGWKGYGTRTQAAFFLSKSGKGYFFCRSTQGNFSTDELRKICWKLYRVSAPRAASQPRSEKEIGIAKPRDNVEIGKCKENLSSFSSAIIKESFSQRQCLTTSATTMTLIALFYILRNAMRHC
eukprot:CAMPEP_0184479684 /NCGR_PEP_ID=MMETSP0113_2-20130426/1313_1 /TAXON_ID=91329 /ORGANISM="Norrisiella sphaerica, Strain BC52" /LENGTH=379 /DNA_ID=CAMNT_0026857813 /DNA_START=126 /DNA_END=1265 /DNA_ORIENTATION=+